VDLINDLLPLIFTTSIYIITFSFLFIPTFKSRLHKQIKDALSTIYATVALLLSFFVYTAVKDLNFSNLPKPALIMAVIVIGITIFAIAYVMALYLNKLEKNFELKLTKLRREENYLIILSLITLAIVLGIYYGFFILLLRQF
jgi:hypothetical protein